MQYYTASNLKINVNIYYGHNLDLLTEEAFIIIDGKIIKLKLENSTTDNVPIAPGSSETIQRLKGILNITSEIRMKLEKAKKVTIRIYSNIRPITCSFSERNMIIIKKFLAIKILNEVK